VLHGELLSSLAGTQAGAQAGDTVVVRQGTPHAFLVCSPEARFLVINAPVGEGFFRDGGTPATSPQPPLPSPEGKQRLATAAERNGVVILGPPPFA
jgi:hypothetical protein